MDKPVLLMIHGLVGSLDYFDPASRLAGATVETCDLLGYGTFGNVLPGQLTLETQVEHVAERIRALGRTGVWVLGHSMGGAIALLLADRHAGLVEGLINVEGNFTLKDAFWSSVIVAKPPEEWRDEYMNMQRDIAGWLERCGVRPTPQRVQWGEHLLANQPADTVYAMSKALLTQPGRPSYLEAASRIVERGVPVHLIAGERSAAAWDVPDFVRAAAKSYTVIPDVGHIMMLEKPDEFCKTVDRLFC